MLVSDYTKITIRVNNTRDLNYQALNQVEFNDYLLGKMGKDLFINIPKKEKIFKVIAMLKDFFYEILGGKLSNFHYTKHSGVVIDLT